MIYSSVPFFFFSAFVILVFAFLTGYRKYWLLLSSLVWLISWQWTWAVLFFSISLFNFLSLSFIFKRNVIQRNGFFSLLLVFNLFFFAFLKSATLLNLSFKTPYGISFFMFMHIGHIIDLWRNPEHEFKDSFVDFSLFPLFFPELIGGPIMRGKDFFQQLKKEQLFSFENCLDGLLIFSVGFCKYFFLSKSLISLNSVFVAASARINAFYLIALGLSGTLQAYVDFSSYCDMGRGIARCLGINLPINFTPFYFAKNPNDYWQRWNITLGTWIRDYISFPAMLKFGRKIHPNWILLFSFLLVGLWHGLTINWIFFGLFNGLIIIGYNHFNKKKKNKWSGLVFVLCIAVGNGIFQRINSFRILDHVFHQPKLWSAHFALPSALFGELSGSLFLFLFLLFCYDYTIEKRGADWPVHLQKKLKVLLLVILLISFIAGLNSNIFLEDITLPPAYFRI